MFFDLPLRDEASALLQLTFSDGILSRCDDSLREIGIGLMLASFADQTVFATKARKTRDICRECYKRADFAIHLDRGHTDL